MNTIINHGFITPKITPDQKIFGSLAIDRKILALDGQWVKDFPVFEKQFADGFDTYGCTVFNTLNALETAYKRLKKAEKNYSDRFTYISSETYPPGNDPHVVAESIRNDGVIDEALLPFSPEIKTLQEFMDMGDASLIEKGKVWLNEFDLKHEWILTGTYVPITEKQARLKESLKFGPLCASGIAWKQRENGLYYKDKGDQDTHWFEIGGYVEGEYWIIFDTYPNAVGEAIKHLEWDYDFGFAKCYYLISKEAVVPVQKISIMKKLWAFIINLLKKI